MLQNKPKSSRKEINLIPLINIIFLLLTFFMVAGTIERVDPFFLNLPDASGQGNLKSSRANFVYLNKDGRIAVNNDFVARKDLSTIINTLLIENKGKEIVIKSDNEASSKDLVWIMKVIESVGGGDVTIITKVTN